MSLPDYFSLVTGTSFRNAIKLDSVDSCIDYFWEQYILVGLCCSTAQMLGIFVMGISHLLNRFSWLLCGGDKSVQCWIKMLTHKPM